MDDRYLALGRSIAGQCPPGFQQAMLRAAFEGGDATLAITCTARDGSESTPDPSAAGRHDIAAALAAVRDGQAAEDGTTWRSCTVTLIAGGGFRMEVE